MTYDDDAKDVYEKLKKFQKLIEMIKENNGAESPEDRLVLPYASGPKPRPAVWKKSCLT